jgi:hypothetical protein
MRQQKYQHFLEMSMDFVGECETVNFEKAKSRKAF